MQTQLHNRKKDAEPSASLDASFAALSDVTRRGVLEQLGRAVIEASASVWVGTDLFQILLSPCARGASKLNKY